MWALLTLGSKSRLLYSSLSFLYPASRCTMSPCTLITSQSKVHLHLWLDRKAASFGFSWAITETCCLLSGFPLAFLPQGFLKTLQTSSTLLSIRTLSFSGLFSPYSPMNNLVAWVLNPSPRYISRRHDTIISGFHVCKCLILSAILWFIDLCHIVPWWRSSIFACSASEFTSSSTWLSGLISVSDTSGS